MRGCFAQWLSEEREEKRAVKHGKSGLRAAICALFGTSRGDLCKTVEKLCKSLQGVKTKNTNCAQRFVRLCVMVRELCKYRFRAAFGVWALWCGGAPFGRFPSRLRRRGSHLGGGGGAVDKLPRGERTGRGGLLCKGASAFAFALPQPAHDTSPISGWGHGRRRADAGRTHGASPISRRGRGRRQADAGRTHGATPISGRGLGRRQALAGRTHGATPIRGQGRGRRQALAGRAHGQGRGLPCALPPLRTVIRHTSGMVRHCARGRPPLPSPSPTLRTAARDTVAQRRGLFSGAARTLPGSGRRANDILYIRVRRREGENVLHRAASNDVDNFSVDNPLWITAAAECRLLCGGRGRRCGEV